MENIIEGVEDIYLMPPKFYLEVEDVIDIENIMLRAALRHVKGLPDTLESDRIEAEIAEYKKAVMQNETYINEFLDEINRI